MSEQLLNRYLEPLGFKVYPADDDHYTYGVYTYEDGSDIQIVHQVVSDIDRYGVGYTDYNHLGSKRDVKCETAEEVINFLESE